MTPEHDDILLSPEGERRREAILRDVSLRLPRIVARRRARRRAVTGSLAIALVLTVGAATLLLRTPSRPVGAPPIVEAPALVAPLIDYAVVRTGPIDPSIYVKENPDAINAMVISDDELLRELAAMGRPAGLIRMNGRVRLSRDVVDPPL